MAKEGDKGQVPSAGWLSLYKGRVKTFLNINLKKEVVGEGSPTRFSVSVNMLQQLLDGQRNTVSIYPVSTKKWTKGRELRLIEAEG